MGLEITQIKKRTLLVISSFKNKAALGIKIFYLSLVEGQKISEKTTKDDILT